MVITVTQLAELPEAADRILTAAGGHRVWLFYGEMGAGKTTLIKAICQRLGVTDVMSSPTFALVNAYTSPHGTVYHFDFYRIKSEQEAFDLGYEEYFYSGNYCFVEWPDKIPNLLPLDAIAIRLTSTGPEGRQITLEIPCYRQQ